MYKKGEDIVNISVIEIIDKCYAYWTLHGDTSKFLSQQ